MKKLGNILVYSLKVKMYIEFNASIIVHNIIMHCCKLGRTSFKRITVLFKYYHCATKNTFCHYTQLMYTDL